MEKKDCFPRIGPFYYYKGFIIAPQDYQRRINPATLIAESVIESMAGLAKEHRDMWDRHMLLHYPELATDFDDNHKALPRGRVDYSSDNGVLSFFITLDKCIVGREDEIRREYNLAPTYSVTFHYGAMNYQCRDCAL
jgi:hypothetical protein